MSFPRVVFNVMDNCAVGEEGQHEAQQLGNAIATHTTCVVDGVTLGVVGYLTPTTVQIAAVSDCVTISDEQPAVESVIAGASGVDVWIALGHSGIDFDITLASNVPELDIIIGGHSHTFLWTESTLGPNPVLSERDDPPGTEYKTTIKGDYPTLAGSSNTPVLQSLFGARYLGHCTVTYNSGSGVTLVSKIS